MIITRRQVGAAIVGVTGAAMAGGAVGRANPSQPAVQPALWELGQRLQIDLGQVWGVRSHLFNGRITRIVERMGDSQVDLTVTDDSGDTCTLTVMGR